LRDLLETIVSPNKEISPLPPPPPIDVSTVPDPPKTNPIARLVMTLMSKKWAAKKIGFGQNDLMRMHKKFWDANNQFQLKAFKLDVLQTKALVARCRQEGVTVNSALWAAFLAAQQDVQKDKGPYRMRSALAVNTRDKLKIPVGEALGFYASSLTLNLPYSPSDSFWDAARKIHSKIGREMKKTNSLYFYKYDGLDEKLSRKLLKMMTWHKVSYGYAITNVGRLEIPTTYGSLEIESVYGPSFYSDVEEKIVGVITVGGKLSVIMACNEGVTGQGAADKLQAAVIEYLDRAGAGQA
jgi:NRPS condensation-like uncharacterized protein